MTLKFTKNRKYLKEHQYITKLKFTKNKQAPPKNTTLLFILFYDNQIRLTLKFKTNAYFHYIKEAIQLIGNR